MKKKKVLIANRGEIACRIAQAVRELRMTPVGVYVEGDEASRHVTFVDEAHLISSYLSVEELVAVAKASGAGAVHPGYGFLSERPVFVRALEEANIAFIGPRAETMEALGGKIAAKELAERIGIPTVPWAKVAPGESIGEAGKRVGFPLLIKAQAGGGGKGMRRVTEASELESAAEAASREAIAAFGDGVLFLERYVENPRHIEVQVFGDGMGEGIHLFERECSLQRRHQKIWEEAPAPHLLEKTRKVIQDSAMKLVRETKYRNAGTIEYLVDSEGNAYFIEMNTRLQVEHPVTELIAGVDLVQMQIELALNPSQFTLPQSLMERGHAIEVRICSEDAWNDFGPCTGKIKNLIWPMGAGIRVDRGIEVGQVVSTQFDSMLAKIIVSAPTRSQAVERMRVALEDTVIDGVGTNLPYLQALTLHPGVIEGKVDTGFLAREASVLLAAPDLSGLSNLLSASLAGAHSVGEQSLRSNPWLELRRDS
jgi:3-methylcrotonyl-CoA carboxylase alpha subunit